MPPLTAWALAPALPRSRPLGAWPCVPRRRAHAPCARRRPRAAAGTPPPPPPPRLPSLPAALRGVNETAPAYAALVAAQALAFVGAAAPAHVADVGYFSITALAVMVIGCKRAPLQAVELTAPLSKEQVLFAPIGASVVLFGAYLLLRYTSIDIGVVFNVMTTVIGGICLKEALDPVVVSALRTLRAENTPIADIEKPEYPGEPVPQVMLSDGLSAATAAAVVALYVAPVAALPPALASVHFVFSNAIAVGIAARVLSIIRPESFVAAAGLLTGLCAYDIFFVFGTDVMVTVATKVDSPGKLLFPRDPAALAASASKYPYAVLGLGDLVVPGIFISLALALDAFVVQKRDPDAPPAIVPAGPYFRTALAAYVLGLGSCFVANFTSNAAQPALLYLVPALIGSALITAGVRGEVTDVVKFRYPARESVFGGTETEATAASTEGDDTSLKDK